MSRFFLFALCICLALMNVPARAQVVTQPPISPGSFATQKATPTTGQTVTASSGYQALGVVLVPAGTLATLTVALPSNPIDGQTVSVVSSQIITSVTFSNGTLGNALTTLSLGQKVTLVYCATDSKWY